MKRVASVAARGVILLAVAAGGFGPLVSVIALVVLLAIMGKAMEAQRG